MTKYFLLHKGNRNSITDVGDIQVGHATLAQGRQQTGITLLMPHKGNLFRQKYFAASHIINGYGKSTGLIQVDELGTLESPIALTNTPSVGLVSYFLTNYMMEQDPEIGRSLGTVNPLVLECNDGLINDQRSPSLTIDHFNQAVKKLSKNFSQGDVGAGRGMICYGFKGGIGTSSRLIIHQEVQGLLGALVLSNFGDRKNLRILGHRGPGLAENKDSLDKGSICIILATDLPLLPHQLKRLAKRAQNGIARTGSYTGHGSGDLVLAFSTGQIAETDSSPKQNYQAISDHLMEILFLAATEAVEEAILQSLFHAGQGRSLDGKIVPSLSSYLEKPPELI